MIEKNHQAIDLLFMFRKFCVLFQEDPHAKVLIKLNVDKHF